MQPLILVYPCGEQKRCSADAGARAVPSRDASAFTAKSSRVSVLQVVVASERIRVEVCEIPVALILLRRDPAGIEFDHIRAIRKLSRFIRDPASRKAAAFGGPLAPRLQNAHCTGATDFACAPEHGRESNYARQNDSPPCPCDASAGFRGCRVSAGTDCGRHLRHADGPQRFCRTRFFFDLVSGVRAGLLPESSSKAFRSSTVSTTPSMRLSSVR
jgi:hypothetical protein